MKKKYCFLFSTLLILTCFNARCQDIIIGIASGINFSPPNTTLFVNGKKESISNDNSLFNGKGLLGFSLKTYGNMPISERLGIQAELGYELMRFKSHVEVLGEGSIHNIALSIAPAIKLYKNWKTLLGPEIVYRFNNSTGSALNGNSVNSSVDPIHFQGFIQLNYYFPNKMYISLGGLIPRLQSVNVYYIGLPQNGYMVKEKLRVFRINIGVPLYCI